MPKLSHHRSIVIHYGVRYEAILRGMLSCEPTSLGDLIWRAEGQLGTRLVRRLREFSRYRNDFSHSETVNTLSDVSHFVTLINQIEQELGRIVPSMKEERLTKRDMQPRLPRLVALGISLIAITCLVAVVFGGFTNIQKATYKTSGFLGWFGQVHHEVHERPNLLFWVVVIAAGIVALWYVLDKVAKVKRRRSKREPMK